MKKVISLLIALICFSEAFSQEPAEISVETPQRSTSLGLGLGMDYGGLGGQLNFQTSRAVELFVGLGYNFNGLGVNGGGKLRLAPDKRVCPLLLGMYGYNAVIVVKGYEKANKTYFGPTFGAGLEINSRNNDNFWVIELLVPIRSKEFKDDFDALDKSPGIEISKLSPVTFSVAYHFKL